jgi:hypothetical protein
MDDEKHEILNVMLFRHGTAHRITSKHSTAQQAPPALNIISLNSIKPHLPENTVRGDCDGDCEGTMWLRLACSAAATAAEVAETLAAI